MGLRVKDEGIGVTDFVAGSYLRLIDSCITQLKAQGPSRTCNESKKAAEEEFPASSRAQTQNEMGPP